MGAATTEKSELQGKRNMENHATFQANASSAGGACSSVSRGVQSGSKSWLEYQYLS